MFPGEEFGAGDFAEAADFGIDRACDVGGEQRVGQRVQAGTGLGGLGVGHVEERGEVRAGLQHVAKVVLAHGAAPAGIDEDRAVAHPLKMRLLQHPLGLRHVGEVVGNDEARCKGLLQAHLAHPEIRRADGGEKMVEHRDFQPERREQLDDLPADRSGPQEDDRLVVVPGAAKGLVMFFRAGVVAQVAEIPLHGEKDLGEGELGDRDRVGHPGTHNHDVALDQRSRESPHRSGGVKDGLEIGQGGELGVGEQRHAPGGEDRIGLGDAVELRVDFIGMHGGFQHLGLGGDPPPGLGRVDGVQQVLVSQEYDFFHRTTRHFIEEAARYRHGKLGGGLSIRRWLPGFPRIPGCKAGGLRGRQQPLRQMRQKAVEILPAQGDSGRVRGGGIVADGVAVVGDVEADRLRLDQILGIGEVHGHAVEEDRGAGGEVIAMHPAHERGKDAVVLDHGAQDGVARGAPDAVVILPGEHGGVAGIERRDQHVLPVGGEHGAQGGGVHAHVGFIARGQAARVADIEAPKHADQPAPGRDVRRASHRRREIPGRRDGDDRHRLRAFLDDPDEAAHAVLRDFAAIGCQIVTPDPRVLIAPARHGMGIHPQADRDIRPARHLEKPRRDRRAVNRIARRGEDEFEVELRAAQQLRQRPGIIDIRTDIGIQNDRNGHAGRDWENGSLFPPPRPQQGANVPLAFGRSTGERFLLEIVSRCTLRKIPRLVGGLRLVRFSFPIKERKRETNGGSDGQWLDEPVRAFRRSEAVSQYYR